MAMRKRWLLIGGPVVVGAVVAGVVIVSLVETPCACEELLPERVVEERARAYVARLAAFDAERPRLTCPGTIAELDALGPPSARDPRDEHWKSLPFVLECTVDGARRERTLTLRHPGADRTLGTSDDQVHRLAPAPPPSSAPPLLPPS